MRAKKELLDPERWCFFYGEIIPCFGSILAVYFQKGIPGMPRFLDNCKTFAHPWILVVSTQLKNISQIGSFPQVGMKIENIWVATTQSSALLLWSIPTEIWTPFATELPFLYLGCENQSDFANFREIRIDAPCTYYKIYMQNPMAYNRKVYSYIYDHPWLSSWRKTKKLPRLVS